MTTKFQYTTLFFLLLLLLVSAGVYVNGYSSWWVILCFLVYSSLLVLGSICIQWDFYLTSVNKLALPNPEFSTAQSQLASGKNCIAITFDDGPALHSEAILDILKTEGVVATFFVIGKNIEGREALLQRMYIDGHVIGNHSFYHGFNFDWQSAKKMQAEIEATNNAITTVTGAQVTLFRPPYGVTNPNLAKAVRRSGMKSIGWNLRSMDTVARDEHVLLQKILHKIKPGSIVLMHDSVPLTKDILSRLIKEIKKRGFEFTTLR